MGAAEWSSSVARWAHNPEVASKRFKSRLRYYGPGSAARSRGRALFPGKRQTPVLLTDEDLAAAIGAGRLTVDPLHAGAIQPASVDLHLGHQFRVYCSTPGTVVDVTGTPPPTRLLGADGGGFVLHPGQFALGCTAERVALDASVAAQLDGVSTVGRYGLIVHSTAGWVDPGFEGQLTLEMSNLNTVGLRLTPGMRIAQLCVFTCSAPARRPYRGRYARQVGPQPPRTPEAS
jgi:dCTP deaminase